ncbi:permease [Alkalihalobacillus sp. MEB130]|uniref:permease n=1 Tax=Alkalihalobacillus sp. MEB130 TaxID=2976704 RepID=UPI0028DF1740|nr:permease [Alkalihalobacillus sp. MEB130]MDT8862189.1 permease [Alkalihalobacillus sp. MEB130]
MAVLVISFNDRFTVTTLLLPESLLTFNMIFLSILIEAIPFVLIGVFIAGMIQIFVTEEHLKKLIPKNPFLAVLTSCLLGALFPACECGIVPIVRRLIAKGVPLFAGVGFLLTGPLINPIVVFSTYMAFGEDLRMALLRMGLGLGIAIIITAFILVLFQTNQLKRTKGETNEQVSTQKQPIGSRLKAMLEHAIDEFFDMGKFLIMGAMLAAFVQTYIATKSILGLGEGILASTLVMMGLAYLLSLCSEADAFIAASFRHLFPQTSLLGFLIYGPMLDLKNTIMMMAVFKIRFVLVLMIIITGTVLGVLLFVHPWV